MELQPGTIVKNLVPAEPVEIRELTDLGEMVSISYSGVNSRISSDKIISKGALTDLEVVSRKGTYDFSGDPEKFTLFTEAERIRSAYQFDPLFAVNCSIIDPLPHQVEAVYKYILPQPRIRFLLADDTGAGKTIMTGLVIKELLLRGLIERILIITPGGLTKQWQEDELALKFNLVFNLVNRASFTADPTIFHSSNRLVTSIDFLRNDDVLNVVQETTWDLIVVDEAHKLSAYDYGSKKYRSKRYEALEILSKNTEHLLLLTATPHRGRQDTFRNLLQLLDNDIFYSDRLVTQRINEEDDSAPNKFFLRRLKENMKNWDGEPLFKDRHTKTVQYELTPAEKHLYEEVTRYLTSRREQATAENNIHVSLALMVMQRRLTSSIKAIRNTLRNRYRALKGLVELVQNNPTLWKRRMAYDIEFNSYEDFDELTDDERETLEHILSDPRKFKLFTTAKTLQEVIEERDQVEYLFNLAQTLYKSGTEEQKLRKLMDFITDQKVIDGKKLVIFTEHKDTLDYLEEKLSNLQYNIQTIYGQKSVDERRAAQDAFAADGHILIATDAAGEGINLQFCNLLINWDIPWNPNRLEQRMGRIHRYGQPEEVYVFNMVAQNTREGKVMQRLLQKLEVIRTQIGSDRVYDVISDVFDGVGLEDVLKSTLNGEQTEFDFAIDDRLTKENVEQLIQRQKEQIKHQTIDYAKARSLKEDSDETRLQPVYIQRFFKRAYASFGGGIRYDEEGIFQLTNVPETMILRLRRDYNISTSPSDMFFCLDKTVFLDKKKTGMYRRLYYINPGSPVFDTLIRMTLDAYREEVLKGTIMISPDEIESYYAFFVRSQVIDERGTATHESVADEVMTLVCGTDGAYVRTSPAKLIDLKAPEDFVKKIDVPESIENSDVTQWSFRNITRPQYEAASERIRQDVDLRGAYVEEGYNALIFDLTDELNKLQGQIFAGNLKHEEKAARLEERLNLLKEKKKERLADIERRKTLHMKKPDVLGCVYVVPLSDVEYESHFGMRRDDEVEQIAMQHAMEYERQQEREPIDVSAQKIGFDIKSIDRNRLKRYIEVKGRATTGAVVISDNEMMRLKQLGDQAWLYVVTQCRTEPLLHRIQNPGNVLDAQMRSKGVQYFVEQEEWERKAVH